MNRSHQSRCVVAATTAFAALATGALSGWVFASIRSPPFRGAVEPGTSPAPVVRAITHAEEPFRESAPRTLAEETRNRASPHSETPRSAAPQNPQAAIAWLRAALQDGDAERGAETWSAERVNDAISRLPELPDSVFRRTLEGLAASWASTAPAEALAWAAELPEDFCIEVGEAALATWARNAPGEVRVYVDSLPESEFRAYAFERTTRELARHEPETAVAWVEGLESGFEKDVALRELADALMRWYHPLERIERNSDERAFTLAKGIAHPVIREEWVERSLSSLISRDPDRALQLIPSAGLPPDHETQLRDRAIRAAERRREMEERRKKKQ